MYRSSILGALLLGTSHVGAYTVLHEYAGSNFFDGWEFYGNRDNLTWGNVTWVTQEVATSQKLAYVSNDDHVIIKVDNVTDVKLGELRNTVRITTQDAYDLGSLWIIDLNHIPYGCSVWLAFWSFGPKWPTDGEIDIIEGINLNTNNQMALHSIEGCYHSGNTDQLGVTGATNCAAGSGCTVEETSPNSFYTGFAKAGGGVFATQFGVSGIFIWFWSRPDIPASISEATSTSSMDISSWGTPHAAYLSSMCNISQFFKPQNIVLDIDLCGVWAGVPSIFNSQCKGQCYNDWVVGPGSPRYDEAYFDINYVRTYTTSAAVPSSTGPSVPTSTVPTPSSTVATSGGIWSRVGELSLASVLWLTLVHVVMVM